MRKLRGVLCPVVTPFDYAGELYPAKLRHNLAKLGRTRIAAYVLTSWDGEGSLLTRPQLGFRGSLVSSTGTQGTTTSSYDLNIKVELEQTPISPGMAKLQSMLDLAISDSQVLPGGGGGG